MAKKSSSKPIPKPTVTIRTTVTKTISVKK